MIVIKPIHTQIYIYIYNIFFVYIHNTHTYIYICIYNDTPSPPKKKHILFKDPFQSSAWSSFLGAKPQPP